MSDGPYSDAEPATPGHAMACDCRACRDNRLALLKWERRRAGVSDSSYTVEAMTELRNKIWSTRDACLGHYPMACPADCANAGKHDSSLGKLCECRECR